MCGVHIPGSCVYILYLYIYLYLYIEIIEFCVYKERYCYKYNTILLSALYNKLLFFLFTEQEYRLTLQGLCWACPRNFLPTVLPRCLTRGTDSGAVRARVESAKPGSSRQTQNKRPCKWEGKHVYGGWPLVVNIGDSHTPGLRDPRMARGWFPQRAGGVG